MENRIEAKPKGSRERLVLWLIVIFLVVVFVVSTVVSVLSAPQPKIMAPGHHYHYQEHI